MKKNKILWALLSLIIAALSIWAVSEQNAHFSLRMLWLFVEEADDRWLAAALACMFGFIAFEGMAIVRISKALGYSRNFRQGTLYGAADVFFSAITPSATGGQPASALFMMNSGMPGMAVTVTLLTNLIMYTAALLCVGLIMVGTHWRLLIRMTWISELLVTVGTLVMITLGILFYMLIYREALLHRILETIIRFFEHCRLIRHGDRIRADLNETMAEYKETAKMVHGRYRMLAEAFFWNVLQRLSQLAVPFCIFRARGETWKEAWDAFVLQSFVALGSNCVPVPGAMGVADYLMLDAYDNILGINQATYMEMVCRSVSFYGCILVSLLIVGGALLWEKGRK